MSNNNLGYLGPSGTYSEDAANKYMYGSIKVKKEFETITAIIDAVQEGVIKEGLVPFENSLEGGVSATHYYLLQQEGLYINGELCLPINHCLVCSEELELSEIKTVMSYPQAIQQCSLFIGKCLAEADVITTRSTAEAAVQCKNSKYSAAIASKNAAEKYGLIVLKQGIEDNKDNRTRFVILSKEKHEPTGYDKTSIVISICDEPGSLHQVLGYFAKRSINLTRIESRPSRRKFNEWLFFIDFEGHFDDPEKGDLWEELGRSTIIFKNLGSYPACEAW